MLGRVHGREAEARHLARMPGKGSRAPMGGPRGSKASVGCRGRTRDPGGGSRCLARAVRPGTAQREQFPTNSLCYFKPASRGWVH